MMVIFGGIAAEFSKIFARSHSFVPVIQQSSCNNGNEQKKVCVK